MLPTTKLTITINGRLAVVYPPGPTSSPTCWLTTRRFARPAGCWATASLGGAVLCAVTTMPVAYS